MSRVRRRETVEVTSRNDIGSLCTTSCQFGMKDGRLRKPHMLSEDGTLTGIVHSDLVCGHTACRQLCFFCSKNDITNTL